MVLRLIETLGKGHFRKYLVSAKTLSFVLAESPRIFLFDFWGPIGDPFGARKGEIRGLKSDLCSSRVPGGVQGSIWGGFLMIFGAMLGVFLVTFCEGFRACGLVL